MSPSAFRSVVLVALCFGSGSLLGQINQNSFDSSDPFASRFKENTRFELKLKAPKPGGLVKITARQENCEQDLTICEAEGDVLVEYQDVKIRADKLSLDREKNTARAEGHVVIDQGPTRLSGERGTFDLKAKTGTLENATADLQPTFHIVARTISKVGEATYDIRDGVFTACEMPHPAWSFRTARALITLDDYARMKNVTFLAAKVPILFTPYLLWPTKEDRVSGFLVPGLGYNSSRGAFLGLTYYWVTSRSTDSTSELDLYSRKVIGFGEEFRWAPSSESAGVFQGFVLRDSKATLCTPGTVSDSSKQCTLSSGAPGHLDTKVCRSGTPSDASLACTLPDGTPGRLVDNAATRWKLRLDHASSDLPGDMRGVISIHDYSDINYLQDYERSYALNSARQISSTAFLTKNFGDDSANLRMERTETFFSSTVLLERTPSLEFSHRTARIEHTPLYGALDASFSRLFMNRGVHNAHGGYFRGDIHPTLSLPLKNIPWLSLTGRAGGRATYYSNSLTTLSSSGQSFTGNSLLRTYSEGGASLVGPSFSRIYDLALGPFSKWKHIIEPRADYTYVSDVKASPARRCDEGGSSSDASCSRTSLAGIPTFDEVDSAFGQNSIRYALVNRILAKRGGPDAAASQEIATLEVSQSYSFRDPQSASPSSSTIHPEHRSPLQATLRVVPDPGFHLDAQASYDTKASRATSFSFTGGANWGSQYANLTWTASRPVVAPSTGTPQPSPNSDFLRGSAGIDLFKKKIRIDTQLNYDAHLHQMVEDRSLLTYKGSCYTILLEVRNLRGPTPRHDYRLVINLKNIGTLLDVNGGIDKIF
jgi:LPS-assembly protein